MSVLRSWFLSGVSPLQSSMPRSCVQRILLFLHSESKPESSLSGGFRLAKDCRIFHREFILWNSTKLTFWLVYQCHPLLMRHGVSEAQSLSCRGQVPESPSSVFQWAIPKKYSMARASNPHCCSFGIQKGRREKGERDTVWEGNQFNVDLMGHTLEKP